MNIKKKVYNFEKDIYVIQSIYQIASKTQTNYAKRLILNKKFGIILQENKEGDNLKRKCI